MSDLAVSDIVPVTAEAQSHVLPAVPAAAVSAPTAAVAAVTAASVAAAAVEIATAPIATAPVSVGAPASSATPTAAAPSMELKPLSIPLPVSVGAPASSVTATAVAPSMEVKPLSTPLPLPASASAVIDFKTPDVVYKTPDVVYKTGEIIQVSEVVSKMPVAPVAAVAGSIREHPAAAVPTLLQSIQVAPGAAATTTVTTTVKSSGSAFNWDQLRDHYASRLIPPSRLIARAHRAGSHRLPGLPQAMLNKAIYQNRAKAAARRPHVSSGAATVASTAVVASATAGGVDLRSKFGVPYDQLQIGSCTANAICGAYRLLEADKSFDPSRMYVYDEERLTASPGQPLTDSGSDAAIGLTWILNHGVCPESVWPYDQTKVNVVPPASCTTAAAAHKLGGIFDLTAGASTRNQVIQNMQTALGEGLPVLIAVAVYQSFMTQSVANTGIIPIPDKNNEQLEGGHEMCVVGFQPDQQRFIVANSWGPSWGAAGFCYMPYAYFQDGDLSFEFLAFSKVVAPTPPPTPTPTPHPPVPTPPPPPPPQPKPPTPTPHPPVPPHPQPQPRPRPAPTPPPPQPQPPHHQPQPHPRPAPPPPPPPPPPSNHRHHHKKSKKGK
jgi:Papain family cysteine protease